jgi:hypothetical protein
VVEIHYSELRDSSAITRLWMPGCAGRGRKEFKDDSTVFHASNA